VITQKKYNSLLNRFKHKAEGYALDWSPLVKGLLATGSCDSSIYLYRTNESEFVMEKNPLKGHKDSVEDLQFSPNQEYVFASCSVDRTIKIWDI
jgi:ribosome assembly protein RRB1